MYCLYTRSCCSGNLWEIHVCMQIHCWDWRLSTMPLLYVMNNDDLDCIGWDLDSEFSRFTARLKTTCCFENVFVSHFQRLTDLLTESFDTTGRLKNYDCFSVDGFCSLCNAVFEAMVWTYHFDCREIREYAPTSLKKISRLVVKDS